MTMFGYIDNDGFFPAKQEISAGSADDNGQTQPNVVRHKDEHQQKGNGDLQDVQQRLEAVHARDHCRPGIKLP